MRRKKSQYCRLLVLALVFGLCSLWSAAATADLVSKPGEYSGYSEVLYDEWVRSSQYVEVEDGTKLAVDIYRPSVDGVAVDVPYPVVWSFTPYRRASYMTDGSIRLSVTHVDLTKYGYVVGCVDVRGRGASYGMRRGELDRTDAQDGSDITEWFAAQPWCDGNVGMCGISQLGELQYMVASAMPPHLKAIFPVGCGIDKYDQWLLGGIGPAPAMNYSGELMTLPVDGDTDGDGDGYPDMLYEAVQQHALSTDMRALFDSIPYRDSVSDLPAPPGMPPLGQFWFEMSQITYQDQIEMSGVAIYHAANWGHAYARSIPIVMANFKNPSKMWMGPAGPGGKSGIGFYGDFDMFAEHLRWYDYWLKDIDNGIMDEPPIYYYAHGVPEGKEWRFAWTWPLSNEEPIHYYLGPPPSGSASSVNDGTLSTTPPTDLGQKDDYIVDYEITDGNRDEKGLTYTTAPLTFDVEWAGYPIFHLWVSSDAADGDFFAYLEDIDTSGNIIFVRDGKLRASHRELHIPSYDLFGLPWHRSFEQDIIPLVPGQPEELVFDLSPASYLFKAGHRIRLTITCMAPRTDTPELEPPPVVTVYRNKTYQSFITLPVTTDPLKVLIDIKPGILNLKSKGLFTAFITPPKRLPKGYRAEDIDISTVTCDGAPAVWGKVVKNTLIAKFDRKDLTDIPTGHKVKLIVKGEFNYEIPFEGKDTIKVINKGK